MTHEHSTAKPHISVTWAEIISWTLVSLGALVFAVAVLAFTSASNSYGDTDGAMMWMITGGALTTLTLTPALILSGFRSMLERR